MVHQPSTKAKYDKSQCNCPPGAQVYVNTPIRFSPYFTFLKLDAVVCSHFDVPLLAYHKLFKADSSFLHLYPKFFGVELCFGKFTACERDSLLKTHVLMLVEGVL